uniref:Uncharacterized protein n=1 Tax=Aegilops tauschii TaxID=37682 RepID=R7W702_AEGTA
MTAAVVDFRAILADCAQRCLGGCSCTAYASAKLSGVPWTSTLEVLRVFPNFSRDLYVRLAASHLDYTNASSVIKGLAYLGSLVGSEVYPPFLFIFASLCNYVVHGNIYLGQLHDRKLHVGCLMRLCSSAGRCKAQLRRGSSPVGRRSGATPARTEYCLGYNLPR